MAHFIRSIAGRTFIVINGIYLSSCSTPTPMPLHPQSAHPHFEQTDTNKDGRISYAEFSKSPMAQQSRDPKAKFARIDTNHDGYLSLTEILDDRDKMKAKKTS